MNIETVQKSDKIRPEHIARKAVVYIRQSTAFQVAHNHESQRRQYGLVDLAKALGFVNVDVIDDDLGRSGSGQVDRPGFQRLVTAVCTGVVGAILCLEASRLARNGRDWHQLIEICALVEAVLIDPDGVYDPRRTNDRLLLGLKGTMSEFELSLLRERSHEAIAAKARRGEYRFRLPVGLVWGPSGIELDPDRRIQDAVRLVFEKFEELGSARQVMLWFQARDLQLPAGRWGGDAPVEWRKAVHHQIVNILNNPLYAGAYVYGRRSSRTTVVEGHARRTSGHAKPMGEWDVVLRNRHTGYISWGQFESNRATMAANTHMKKRMEAKAGRGGRALLSGLLRCARCGRKLTVQYITARSHRYRCRTDRTLSGTRHCIEFAGRLPDVAVSDAVLKAVEVPAIDAALDVAARRHADGQQLSTSLERKLEETNYRVELARRRYESVDAANRLVAAELEARWNRALLEAQKVADDLARAREQERAQRIPERTELLALAANLATVWNAPATDARLKQRIVRTLIREAIVDVDEQREELVLIVHWHGGQHTELRMAKRARCRKYTDLAAVEVLGRLAGRFPDDAIASIMNRMGLRTGAGNTWTAERVYSARNYHGLPAHDPTQAAARGTITITEAAQRLGVHHNFIRRLIRDGVLAASQVTPLAPWEIRTEDLSSPAVERVAAARRTRKRPSHSDDASQLLMFSRS